MVSRPDSTNPTMSENKMKASAIIVRNQAISSLTAMVKKK
jgi:hypothetical protein